MRGWPAPQERARPRRLHRPGSVRRRHGHPAHVARQVRARPPCLEWRFGGVGCGDEQLTADETNFVRTHVTLTELQCLPYQRSVEGLPSSSVLSLRCWLHPTTAVTCRRPRSGTFACAASVDEVKSSS